MVDSSTIDNGLLISLIENQPVLWDKTMDFYKSRVATQTAWKLVLKSLYPESYMAWNDETRKANVKLIKQRWTHIRDNYCRSFRRQAQRTPDERPTKPYIYSKRLAFLHKIMPGNEAVNVEENDENIKTEPQEIYSESIDISDDSLDMNDIGTMNSEQSEQENMPDLEDTRTHDDDANDSFSTQEPSDTDRHHQFFKGILPSLNDFDDNETLDFQMGVLKLVKEIKSSRQRQQFPSFRIKFEDDSNGSGYS